jgi:hypothetical protein
MSVPVERGYLPSPTGLQGTSHLSQDAVKRKASEILDVGDQWFRKDDYEARMDAFAREMARLDQGSRAALMDEILEQDSGALASWLDTDRLDSLVDSGRVTGLERNAIRDGFAQAYVDNKLSLQQAKQFTGFVDAALAPGHEDKFLQGLQMSDSAVADQFAQKFATDALKHHTLNPNLAVTPPNQPKEAALLLNALEQSGGSSAVRTAQQQLTGAQKMQLQRLAFDDQFSGPQSAQHGVRDPAAILIDSATKSGLDGEVSGLARAATEQGVTQDHVDRNNALAKMLAERPEAVLGELGKYKDVGAHSQRYPDLKGQEVNTLHLAKLMELTVLNPKVNAEDRKDAGAAVVEYARQQAQKIEASDHKEHHEGYEEPAGRMKVLSAALDVAVTEGFEQLAQDEAEKKQAFGFAADVALAALPVSSLKGATGASIAEALPESSPLKGALEGVSGQVIDGATGTLTAKAKDELYKALSSNPDLAPLRDRESAADFLRNTIIEGIADEAHRDSIRGDAYSLAKETSETLGFERPPGLAPP